MALEKLLSFVEQNEKLSDQVNDHFCLPSHHLLPLSSFKFSPQHLLFLGNIILMYLFICSICLHVELGSERAKASSLFNPVLVLPGAILVSSRH